MNLETVQIVIVAALSISTVLVVIIAIQVIMLLRDLRKIVRRVERITDGVNMITSFLENSLGEVSTFAEAGKGILKIIGKIIERKAA